MLIDLTTGLNHILWYYNIFFYLFLIAITISAFVIINLNNKIRLIVNECKTNQSQEIAKLDSVRKDHSDVLERIRIEMLKREEERNRQWMESEKETLHVLSGVSNLLDLSDKLSRVESDKIIKKLEEIQDKVEKITTN